MIISLEIQSFYAQKIEDLKEKELVPNMIMRRRLTRNAKMLIYLADMLRVKNERIVYGSSYGELRESISILKSIFEKSPPSPTDFQNSVYNAPASYLSILNGNTSEIISVSNGGKTGDNVLKTAAIKAMDGDSIFCAVCESFDIDELRLLNKCGAPFESAVGLMVKHSGKKPDIIYDKLKPLQGFAPSIAKLMSLCKYLNTNPSAIVGIEC
ncbi:MAG: beta-ketoacyl synthase chain length factor [Campylobacteraceae bacterium]|nr:beta-ketoacyl synthase chain length factor [Campylobacteraceae bacterium]